MAVSVVEKSVRPKGVHLVGSVLLSSNAEVFEVVAETIGPYLHRIPDGETGVRARWNSWTAPTYERTPGLELIDPVPGNYTPWPQARLVIDPEDFVLARLGFSDAALASYKVFADLKARGVIPGHLRFQVCLPSPIAPMIILVEESSRANVEKAHIKQLDVELNEIFEGVPHEELAIQWDVCQDVGVWEGFYPAYFEDPQAGVVERLRDRIDSIPEDVEVGMHLCYGDFGHRHFMEPNDTGVLKDIVNGVCGAASRTVNWVHLPVPIDRDDDAYFAPLAELRLAPETELYLGLIHFDDAIDGAQRRIETARRVVSGFGIATECGFGRRPPETIGPLLDLHAALAEPVV